MKSVRKNSTLVLGSLVLIGSFCLGYVLKKDPSAPSEKTAGSSKIDEEGRGAVSSRTISETDSQRAVNFCQRAIIDGQPGDASTFLQYLALLHPDDNELLLIELANNLHDNAEKLGPFVQALAVVLYDQDPKESLSMLAEFPRTKAVVDVERYLLKDRLTKSPEALYQQLRTWQSDFAYASSSQVEQLASIYAKEHSDQFHEWKSWLKTLDVEKYRNLYQHSFQAAARQANPAQIPQLLELITPDLESIDSLWDIPKTLISRQSKGEPSKAADALIALPAGPWKSDALKGFLETAGKYHPEKAIEVLSDRDFLQTFAGDWLKDTDQGGKATAKNAEEEFFDDALATLLSSTIQNSPQIALDSADSFYNSELRDAFKQEANSRLKPTELPRR